MERVLITGADGFIGRCCLPRLLGISDAVHATTIDGSGVQQYTDVKWHVIDLLHRDQLTTLIQNLRPTHLLHLAWNVDEGVYWNDPGNLDWLKRGVDLFKTFHECGGKRIVAAGSCAEYRLHPGYLSEDTTELKPENLYAGSKHALQILLNTYCKHSKLSYAWGRIFFLYGPHEKPGRLVPAVIRSLLANEEARCSHGNQIRDYLHVDDVADAFVRLLQSPLQGPVNIASGEPVRLKHIISRIAELMGAGHELVRLGALPVPDNEPPFIVADVSRLTRKLGWRPSYDLDTGLSETIAWWKKNLIRYDN